MRLIGGIIKRGLSLANRVQGFGQSPIDLQRKTLKRLVKKAAYTSFGQHYGFNEILQADDIIAAFQEKVPYFDYDRMHDEWWYRALNNEPNVSWPAKVKYFALSSGTTGAPSKYLPMTDDMIRSIRKAGTKAIFAATKFGLDPDFFTKQGLFIGGSTSLKDRGGYFVGDMSGINVKERAFWVRTFMRPEENIQSIADWNKRIEVIAKKAPQWDIGFISGIPSWVQLTIEKVMEFNNVDNIHEIWPNLQVIAHGGIAFEPHRRAFDALMRKPMIYIDTYLASEGFLAFQNRPETRSMAVILNNGVFQEYIPFNDKNFDGDGQLIGNPKAMTVENVELGKEYAVVMSTCAGAWRYIIGDTVRFTDIERKELIITGRTKHFLSVTGEHLSVDNMNQAIQHVQKILNVTINDYTVAAVQDSAGAFAHRWYIGCDMPVSAAELASNIDAHLCAINDDYTTERGSVLRLPEIYVVPTKSFLSYLESKGKIGGQSKFPRVMKKEQFADWEAFASPYLQNT
jgi:hypothetical protein